MSAKCLRTAGFVLVALLTFPLTARANIFDFIWEMSGPQMIGVTFHCEYDPQFNRQSAQDYRAKSPTEKFTRSDCRFFDERVVGNSMPRSTRRFWLSFDTTFYTSTGKDSDTLEYDAFETQMLAIEPILEVRSHPWKKIQFHHGIVGLSYDVLFGSNFDTFDKAGIKFRPVGVTIGRFNVAYNLRLYPNGFTTDEFGPARIDNLNRKHEYLHGFSIGYLWR